MGKRGRPKKSEADKIKEPLIKKPTKDELMFFFKSHQFCTACGEVKNLNTDFYQSKSILYKSKGRMCVCKDCIKELYEYLLKKHETDKRAIYELCKLIDFPFNSSCFETAIKEAERTAKDFYSTYLTKMNSIGEKNNFGICFEDSDKFFGDENNSPIIENKSDIVENIDEKTIMFWGEGLSKEDYIFLESEYKNLRDSFECDSYTQKILFSDIAHQRLEIKRKRQSGNSVDKELKTLQDLLGSANIKPVQESGANVSDQVTFGTLIKKWENEKPIPEPSPEFKDVDGIKKYINVWFLGHLCKMLNIKNDFSEMYEEEVAKHTVVLENSEPESSNDGLDGE